MVDPSQVHLPKGPRCSRSYEAKYRSQLGPHGGRASQLEPNGVPVSSGGQPNGKPADLVHRPKGPRGSRPYEAKYQTQSGPHRGRARQLEPTGVPVSSGGHTTGQMGSHLTSADPTERRWTQGGSLWTCLGPAVDPSGPQQSHSSTPTGPGWNQADPDRPCRALVESAQRRKIKGCSGQSACRLGGLLCGHAAAPRRAPPWLRPAAGPRRIWPLLKKTSKIYCKKH